MTDHVGCVGVLGPMFCGGPQASSLASHRVATLPSLRQRQRYRVLYFTDGLCSSQVVKMHFRTIDTTSIPTLEQVLPEKILVVEICE